MARSITKSRIHKRWCNSHDTLDIKMVTLQGRTEQKLDWHFDPRRVPSKQTFAAPLAFKLLLCPAACPLSKSKIQTRVKSSQNINNLKRPSLVVQLIPLLDKNRIFASSNWLWVIPSFPINSLESPLNKPQEHPFLSDQGVVVLTTRSGNIRQSYLFEKVNEPEIGPM